MIFLHGYSNASSRIQKERHSKLSFQFRDIEWSLRAREHCFFFCEHEHFRKYNWETERTDHINFPLISIYTPVYKSAPSTVTLRSFHIPTPREFKSNYPGVVFPPGVELEELTIFCVLNANVAGFT